VGGDESMVVRICREGISFFNRERNSEGVREDKIGNNEDDELSYV